MFADLDVRVTEQLEVLLICLSDGSVTLVPQCTFLASRLATRTAPSADSKIKAFLVLWNGRAT